ncbi:right-handed parallel beta-helix repeat-containing protein [Rhizobium sp. XQZ8]|uniref:right-handed parallel beta-helix repeat-containing protein n=1 Tax=Rhizobium populisoli TaxID=2859785 RepID=UPI001CA4CC39|nr:hypothetical protein [Rhizobium populisoli]MBW6420392.1 right-handed parallel beta-helix repeat-containing protein [Rhizobium populisoli]
MTLGTSNKSRSFYSAFVATFVSLALAHQAGAAEPLVFWASDPVQPGQTVQVSGSGFAEVDRVEVSRLDDSAADLKKSAATQAEILGKSENTLSFVLPAQFQTGVFSVSAQSGADRAVFQINAPDIYWSQGDRGTAVTPGGWLRISGRNIAIKDGSVAQLTSTDGKATEIRATTPDMWSATYPIPESLKTGVYQVKLWNGAGDLSAWRDAGKIVVEASAPTDRPVMELFANQPDAPSNNDTARINASLQALSRRGGGTLLLHYGVYRFTDSLTIPDGVSLKGEGSGLVTLIWKDADTPPDSLIQGVRDFAVEDLTIYAQRHFHIVKGGLDLASGATVGQNITIRNVIVRASAFTGHLQKDQLRERLEPMQRHRRDGVVGLLLGGRNIRVEGCDILTSMRPIVLTQTAGAYVTNNTFRNGRLGWYGISAPDGVIFENNRIVGHDMQAAGGGINTFDGPFARNVLIRHNSFETILGWDREAMTSDGPGGYYRGAVTVTSPNTVKIANPEGLGTRKDGNWTGPVFLCCKGAVWAY